MKLSDLKLNPSNPQKFDDLSKLENSIKEFPKMMELRPLVIDNDNMVLGGNKRLVCLQNLKYKEIHDSWVKRADTLTEAEQKRFIIADNVGFGQWDWDVLSDWEEPIEDWGLDLPDDWGVQLEAEEDDFEVPDEIQTDIVLGDLIEIGDHRLLCGDSTDSDQVSKLMDGEKADMVFTDPPYGVGYSGGVQYKNDGTKKTNQREKLKNDETPEIYGRVIPVIAEYCDGPCYVWFAASKAADIYTAIGKVGEIHAMIVWQKNGGYAALGANYKQAHEPCLYWKPKGKTLKWIGESTESTIWDINKDGVNTFHPTQKPVSLAAKAIGNHEGGNVMDLFLGSGSTMVASHQLNRKCYGMELDPKYCQVIVDRMKQLEPNIDIKVNGEEYRNE